MFIQKATWKGKDAKRHRGFTLIQILVVIGVMAVLSAIVMGAFSRVTVPANRVKCDVNLKQVALAIDTFRQERGRMPEKLKDLLDNKYLTADVLRCPADPDLGANASDPNYISYKNYYVIREPRDSGELPIIVCPFHEKDGPYGDQAYKGGYTKQFATKPASLSLGDFAGTVMITRPGGQVLTLPTSAAKPLELHGGDRIKTGAGTAKIRFADGSEADIQQNTDINVMQSFVEGQSSGTLYTLVHQESGKVNYYVNPGSHFDVATPTATAGALGTRFTLEIVAPTASLPDGDTILTVTQHVVAYSTKEVTVDVTDTDPPIKSSEAKTKKARKPRTKGKIK
jgi:type II secretory pathway pseudopilin PulG